MVDKNLKELLEIRNRIDKLLKEGSSKGDGRQLLVEHFQLIPHPELLSEADISFNKVNRGSSVIIAGKLQEAETENQNGRVYPRHILEREANEFMKRIKANGVGILGELDHSEEQIVLYQNVSHFVTDLWWEGNALMGKVELLSTPKGMILQTINQRGFPIGMSSKGIGSVSKKSGKTVVGDDYQLICWDSVVDPSTHGAFAGNRIHESKKESDLKELFKEILRK